MGAERIQAKDWPHSPLHRIGEAGVYMVTAATLDKCHLFDSPDKLTLLENLLLSLAKKYSWQLEAWAVFSNHYHFVARSEPNSGPLGKYLKNLHANAARELNRLDNKAGRTV